MADNNEKVFLTEQGVEDLTTALGKKFVWLSRLLDGNGKILPTLLPDFILGQVMFGGTIDANGIITPSNAYRNRYAGEFANGDVTLDVDSLAASTHEGVYFIASAKGESGVVATKLGVEVGDWVISNGQDWTKIDNTDAVKSVANLTGAISAEALRNATLADTANTMWYASAKGVLSSFATTQYGRSLLSAESLTKVVDLFAEKAEKDANGNIITSTYMPLAGGTFTGDVTHNANILLDGGRQIYETALGGSLIATNTTNKTVDIAYGSIKNPDNLYTTKIHGKAISFIVKNGESAIFIDENKNTTAYGNFYGLGGVSAKGIADFDVRGSSGGNGGAHYTLSKELISDASHTLRLTLKPDDGSKSSIIDLTGNDIPKIDFSSKIVNKPTTLGGYGITDAYTKSQIENGVFPNMRVGLADDLGDIEETLDEEYTFQPTANPNEIRDGYAQIESLKGNSLVWNQKAPAVNDNYYRVYNSANASASFADGIATVTVNNYTVSFYHIGLTLKNRIPVVVGHYYGYMAQIKCDKELSFDVEINNSVTSRVITVGTNWTTAFFYAKADYTTSAALLVPTSYLSEDANKYYVKDIQFFDLTQMFGEGNEPTTVEEFYARCPKGMPMDYNEGEVIHFNGDLKSVGFNQWDEEWEVGSINVSNGTNGGSSSIIRTKNYIRVIPSANYYIKAPTNYRIFYYDADKNYITNSPETANESITMLDNAHYIRLRMSESYGTTYNHDICINISDTDKNGTYEPYTEFRRDLPTELFEGGMKSAGTAHDEIYWDKAKGKYIKVTRVGEVDLGALSWSKLSSTTYGDWFEATFNGSNGKINSGGLTPFYKASTLWYIRNTTIDKACGVEKQVVAIRDSSYTDANAFKAAMQGVMLYYELAEPIVEEIDIPYMDYQVSNSGTEEIVSDVPTTPIKARVTYNFDTVGTVRQNRFDISNIRSEGVAKLKTPRTIWGQSFDGSGNVDGNFHTSGEVFLENGRSIRMRGSEGTNFNVLFVSGTDLYIGYDSPSVNFANSKMLINSLGNVGIGTTNPQYKLDVNGSFNAQTLYQNGRKMVDYLPNPSEALSLNDATNQYGITSRSWVYAQSNLVSGQPLGDGASSAATVWDLGGNYPIQIYHFYNSTTDIKWRSVKSNVGDWHSFLHSGNTSLSVDDTKDGFTLNVNGNQVGMSAMTKARIEEIVNAALQD